MRRLVSLAVLLAVLLLATFTLVRIIPGDPAVRFAGPDVTESELARIRQQLGLDRPFLEQFMSYAIGVSHGQLGTSFVTRQAVGEVIGQRIGTSIQLATASFVLVILVAIPGGMLAAAATREGRHQRAEVWFATLTSIGGSIPDYLTATFLAFVFAVWLRLLPVAGTEGWQSLVLPTLSVAIRPIAVLTRIVRLETLNVLAQDYIRMARSKQLPERLIYLRHALPNVATSSLTLGGVLFAGLIGGAVVVENVFARPGLGTALISAVLARDYPVVQGTMLVLGATVVAVNAVIDVLAAAVDPRSMTRQS